MRDFSGKNTGGEVFCWIVENLFRETGFGQILP
jgi:hypothetical protein